MTQRAAIDSTFVNFMSHSSERILSIRLVELIDIVVVGEQFRAGRTECGSITHCGCKRLNVQETP